jgi:HAD superfamily hydrolase (TIGR01484 family)
MKELSELSRSQATDIRAVFTDIDGTLTDQGGRIASSVFAAMERARQAGVVVVPITGRPAGWCDLIARTWPIDGVIGENGGLYFRCGAHGESMLRIYAQDEQSRRLNRERLQKLGEDLLRRHPGAALASDQGYREFDLAVDFCEDVAPLPDSEVDDIVRFLQQAGCTVKVSNIHVNAWFGDFDKASMCLRYARERFGWDLRGADNTKVAFFGDSPNDAPLFELFELGIGVANVRRMADRMSDLPALCTRAEGGEGFIEGIDHILAARILNTDHPLESS